MSALEQIAPRLARAHAAARARMEHPPSGPFTVEPFRGRAWCRGCGEGVQTRVGVSLTGARVMDVLGRWCDEHVCVDGEREDGR